MGTPDLGSEKLWRAGCIFAGMGMIALIVLIVKGIIWLFNNVQIG
jgi:hypothetical protein